ncbi:MAG: hypothetical protein ACFE8L_03725 [Candidatus Hodarchaeota archaeon]
MEMLKIQEKVMALTDEQIKEIYSYTSKLSLDTIEDLAYDLLKICLTAEKGELKNELGRIIFHLQKTERLNTRIGLEKLLDGALRVNAEKVFKLLGSSEPDAQELLKEIKGILKV